MVTKELLNRIKNNDPTLTKPFLFQQKIDADGAIEIAEALKNNNNVTELNLSDNNMGNAGTTAIAKMLETNNTITWLDLCRNNIGTNGAIAIAQMLEINKTITKLSLRLNNIGPGGATIIAEMLTKNNTITWLDLSEIILDRDSINTLMQKLATNKTITHLSLTGNKHDVICARKIASMLTTNNTITGLNLSGNNIGNTGAEAIESMLKTNTTILHIDLDQNNINDDILTTINAALERNRQNLCKKAQENITQARIPEAFPHTLALLKTSLPYAGENKQKTKEAIEFCNILASLHKLGLYGLGQFNKVNQVSKKDFNTPSSYTASYIEKRDRVLSNPNYLEIVHTAFTALLAIKPEHSMYENAQEALFDLRDNLNKIHITDEGTASAFKRGTLIKLLQDIPKKNNVEITTDSAPVPYRTLA